MAERYGPLLLVAANLALGFGFALGIVRWAPGWTDPHDTLEFARRYCATLTRGGDDAYSERRRPGEYSIVVWCYRDHPVPKPADPPKDETDG